MDNEGLYVDPSPTTKFLGVVEEHYTERVPYTYEKQMRAGRPETPTVATEAEIMKGLICGKPPADYDNEDSERTEVNRPGQEAPKKITMKDIV